MPICSFCERKFENSGKMLVMKTGKFYYFCSKKCERSEMDFGRKGRETKWVTKNEKTNPDSSKSQ